MDLALYAMGIQPGAIVEISGPQSSGKTTLCQHIVAQAQQAGGLCAWLDTDHSFNPAYAISCGVRPDSLFIGEPVDMEQALEIVQILAASGAFRVLVFDSLPALTLHSEISNERSQRDLHLLSNGLHRLIHVIQRSGSSLIFTDLSSSRLSATYHQLAENTDRLTLKLLAAQRFCLIPSGELNDARETIGIRVRVKVIKNGNAPFWHESYFDIIYGQGINKSGEVLDLGIRLKLIQKQDSGYYYRATCLGSSVQETVSFLSQNCRVRNAIEKAIRQTLMPKFNTAAT